MRVLIFLARRIAAEPVAMVLATRRGFEELPGIELCGPAGDEFAWR